MKKTFDVAVVGATGLVGSKMIELLESRDFPVGQLFLFATEKSAGRTVRYKNQEIEVIALGGETILKNRADIALFAAGGETAKKFAPLFSALGCTVIDNSSAFRMEEHVPLVVPSVNGQDALAHDGIISNPNCSTIIALSAVAPLYKKFGAKRIIYNTYQAVSGAGIKGLNDLLNGTNAAFIKPIERNVIPLIGDRLATGYTVEEQKMIDETQKILGDSSLAVTATAVRVPVLYGHSISVNIELRYSASLEDVMHTLSAAGLVICDCPTPLDAAGKNEIFVGRVRRDFSHPNTFNLWVLSDNVLKGAALNAVEIAELFI